MGLDDRDIAGGLEFAQVDGEVAGRHPQGCLQPREGDPVGLPQRGQRDDDPQPCLGVDDGIEVGHFALRVGLKSSLVGLEG